MTNSALETSLTPAQAPRPPRVREAHAHLAMFGQALAMPSLADCSSVPECLDRVRALQAGGAGPGARAGRWVRLWGARVEAWSEARWPTLDELDAATGDVPCAIMSFDYHHVFANTAALRATGAPTPTDDRGQPTGLLREQAGYAVWKAAPQPERPEFAAHVARGLDELARLGYHEVHDLHAPPLLAEVLHDLDRAGRLALNVWLYPALSDLTRVAASREAWESPRLRLAGGKVFADGTLNGRTAAMLHRYCFPIAEFPRGQCLMSPGAMDDALRQADALGLPLAVHAIGDFAVRMTLDAIERVRPAARGQRLEHAEIIDAADVPRFAALGVTCSVQPCHLLADVEALHKYVAHRLPRVLPLRELLDSGLAPGHVGVDGVAGLVFGSDVPIVPADPLDSIQAAVHRRRAGEPEAAMLAPRQAISEREAWACFGIA